jgi:Helix-turn-helix domain/Protein of unknown function (DUF2442)
MTTKTRTGPFVEFFATSPRLAHAFRYAARHNNVLTRLAKMHELGHVPATHRGVHATVQKLLKRAGNIVVLSHADEDYFVPAEEKIEDLLSGAFYLLFTEPATHPNQIVQWARRAKIRSENRLHVVKVADLENPNVSHLLGRVCVALAGDEERGSIIDAYTLGDSLIVRGPKHRLLQVPMSALPSLRDKPRAAQENFEIDPDGSFLHWPDLDVHLGWSQFLQAVDPDEFRKAQQRSAEFNRRYGTAIRKLREEAGITQSKIPGLTARQLRRIEQGESRATSRALAALAKAHGLNTDAYLEKLAKAMK